jgi:branched-chain amino acid transport system ATP-binding protein
MAAVAGAPLPSTPLLSTRGLSRSFGGLKAVDGVDFDLTEGEVRAVIGPNGAGKTTFVSLISGRIAPTAGRIVFDGVDVTRLPAHKRVGLGIAYTFQITSIYAALSVADNVALAAQRGAGGAALRRAVDEALARVGLAERARELAGNLAYGHQRLLEVAMGLALKPRLLILDEPTQGLSDAEIDGFVLLVREIARGATVMLIEHNMAVVMALADRITVMDRGRVIAEGAPDAIRADPAVQEAYLGAPQEAASHG